MVESAGVRVRMVGFADSSRNSAWGAGEVRVCTGRGFDEVRGVCVSPYGGMGSKVPRIPEVGARMWAKGVVDSNRNFEDGVSEAWW